MLTYALTEFQKLVLKVIQDHSEGIEELDLRDVVYSWKNHKGSGWRTAHIKRACEVLRKCNLVEPHYTSRSWMGRVELIIIWRRKW